MRRSSQADRAANSDVVITGEPLLERLWLELQDARDPTPLSKLQQAERDIAVAASVPGNRVRRLPVVIWHRIRERSHQVTTRLWVLDDLRCPFVLPSKSPEETPHDIVVTLDLRAFIELVHAAATPGAAP